AVVEPGPSAELAATQETDALLAACRLVGQHLGIAIEPPPSLRSRMADGGLKDSFSNPPSTIRHSQRKGPGHPKRGDAVAAIARASRVRVRRVALRDDWWRNDHGPLLAFTAADPRPGAPLPAAPTNYHLADPL